MSRTSLLIFGGQVNESKYRKELEARISGALPGCLILRNNAKEIQGICDIVVFYGERYGFLEIKVSENAPVQPNQTYYVNWLDEMSFAAFIYPENEYQILSDLILWLEQGVRHNV